MARERARRLLLPFIVVYIVFIPPWQFIDLEYDYNNPGIWNMKSRFFAWYVSYWTEGGWITHFDLAWLWFLPALYIITLLATPIFLVAEQRLRCKNIIIALTLFTLLSACLSVFGFSNGFIFFSFLAVFGPLGVAQIVPLPFEANATSSSLARALFAHNAIVIGSQMGIAQSFSYAAIDPPQDPSQSQKTSAHSPAAMVPMLVLSLSIYIHGYFQQRWGSGLHAKQPAWWTILGKVVFLFSIINLIYVCSPMGDVEDAHYVYPVYSVSYWRGRFFGSLYVLGTFANLALITWVTMAHLNEIGSPDIHKHATRSTMVVYMIHSVFVKVIAFLVIRPALARYDIISSVSEPWMGFALAVGTFVAVVVCSLSFYTLLVYKLPACGKLFGI